MTLQLNQIITSDMVGRKTYGVTIGLLEGEAKLVVTVIAVNAEEATKKAKEHALAEFPGAQIKMSSVGPSPFLF